MGRTTSDGGRSWYRRPNLWIWLAVFYVLSPKMGTIAALAEIAPRKYDPQARDVLHAHFRENGDVAVCFLMDRFDNGEVEEYEVELPISLPYAKPSKPVPMPQPSKILN